MTTFLLGRNYSPPPPALPSQPWRSARRSSPPSPPPSRPHTLRAIPDGDAHLGDLLDRDVVDPVAEATETREGEDEGREDGEAGGGAGRVRGHEDERHEAGPIRPSRISIPNTTMAQPTPRQPPKLAN